MEKENKYKYLAKNTALFTVSSFGSKILTFLLVPLYTSVLSTSEYGIADLITTSVMLLGYIFTLNISDAVLRFSMDTDDPKRIMTYGFRTVFIGSLLVGIMLFLCSQGSWLSWPKYCFTYMWAYYFGLQLSSLFNSYLRAIDKVKYVAISGLLTTSLTIISNLVFLLVFRLRLSGYLLSMVIGVIGTCIYQLIVIKLPVKVFFLLPCEKTLRKEMIFYSFPLIFNGIAWWMNSSLDKYFITYLIGTGAAGIYAVSYKIPTLLTMLQSIFNQAWNLSAIKEFDREDNDGFFSKTYSFYNAGLTIACSVLLLVNIPLARILFAKDFFEAWKYAPFLIISTLFSTMSGFVGSVFSAVKNSKVYAVSTVSAAAVNMVLNYILIPKYGVTGAAVATVVSFFVVWLIRVVCSKKYIRWKVGFAKDAIVYLLLIIQCVLSLLSSHYYALQLLILIIIMFFYNNEISSSFKVVRLKIVGRNENE